MNLRKEVLETLQYNRDVFTDEDVVDAIADLLSATGAPAYIRVADDLRGEWVDEDDAPAWTSEDFKTAQVSKDGAVLRGTSGDLRGVVRGEGVCDEPGCDNDSTEIDMDTGRETCALHHEDDK